MGVIDGSVSYLFSTVPLDNTPSRSTLLCLRELVPGYCQLQGPHSQQHHYSAGDVDAYNYQDSLKPTLLYATLHLPPPTTLNALFMRRISPTVNMTLAVCSNRGPPLSKSAPQASILTKISHDTGRYSNEYLFSTDNALLGWRGLWNFAQDAPRRDNHSNPDASSPPPPPLLPSLLSAGAEAYYSPLTSLVGMSTGLRFSTLPATTTTSSPSSAAPSGTFPYTLTLTLTPLTGSLSTSYSVCASRNLAFSSRFSFNVYSWESEIVAGCELWRQSKRRKSSAGDGGDDNLEWARRKLRGEAPLPAPLLPSAVVSDEGQDEDQEAVVKLRVDQSCNVRLLWEGRVKELLVSAGVGLGPPSFSSLASTNSASSSAASFSGGQSAGGGAASYWRGVGVSVLYSS